MLCWTTLLGRGRSSVSVVGACLMPAHVVCLSEGSLDSGRSDERRVLSDQSINLVEVLSSKKTPAQCFRPEALSSFGGEV